MGSYLSGGRSMSTLQMHLTVFISRRRSGACPVEIVTSGLWRNACFFEPLQRNTLFRTCGCE